MLKDKTISKKILYFVIFGSIITIIVILNNKMENNFAISQKESRQKFMDLNMKGHITNMKKYP